MHHGEHPAPSHSPFKSIPPHAQVNGVELLAISATDLFEIFKLFPQQGRWLHQAFLKEHKRKAKLRAISLRMLMSEVLGGQNTGPEHEENMVALSTCPALDTPPLACQSSTPGCGMTTERGVGRENAKGLAA